MIRTANIPKKHVFSRPIGAGIAVFLVSFSLYLHTLLPSVGYSGDTAKFQFIGKVLGIPHPPGYPLYILLNHLFGKLPVGNLAYRINLMSAFFASLTLVLLFFVIWRIIRDSMIALFTALVFGFTQTFWSQALIAEVYTLHACFLAGVILLLILWAQEQQRDYFYLACLCYAISFGNHLLMITVLPAFAVFVLLTDYRILWSKKTVTLVLLCIIAGMLQYIYVFVRLSAPFSELVYGIPPWAYSQSFAARFRSFINFVTGREFRSNMFVFSLEELIRQRIPMFFTLLRENFSLWGLIAGCIGIGAMLKTRKNSALLLLLLILGNLAYALNYDIGDIPVYFIPTYLVFSIFIGYCAWTVANLFPRLPHVFRSGQYLLVLLALGWLGWKLVMFHYPVVNQHDNIYEDLFTTTVLERIEPRSIVLLSQENVENYHWTMHYFYQIFGAEKWRNAPIPFPRYFFSSPSSPTGQFPFSLWHIDELDDYFRQHVSVYAQAEVDRLRDQGYFLRKMAFQQGDGLINFLQHVPSPCLLLISIKSQGTRALTPEVSRALTIFGLSQSQNLLDKPFHSYAAIGVKHAGSHATGIEALDLAKVLLAVKKGERIGTSDIVAPEDLMITSHGFNEKDKNEIRVKGKNYSKNQPGMNVVVLNAESGDVLHTTYFPTHRSLYQNEVALWKISGKVNNTGEIAFTEELDEEMSQFWQPEQGIIDLTDREHRKYLLRGWAPTKRWGTGAQLPSEIVFYLGERQDMRLMLEFVAGSLVPALENDNRNLHVYLNGTLARTITLPPATVESFILPKHILKQGFNLLRLQQTTSGRLEQQHSYQESCLIGLKKLSFSKKFSPMAGEPE